MVTSSRDACPVVHKYVSHDMLLCMRTTLDLNDTLLRQAKKKAAERGEPLRDLVEAALRTYLSAKRAPKGAYRLEWHTEHGRMMPGVRLDDRDALFDLMDDLR